MLHARTILDNFVKRVVLCSLVIIFCTACGSSSTGDVNYTVESWKPKPVATIGLDTLATIVGRGENSKIILRTEHGDVDFWAGVNLGATLPGSNPGEVLIPDDKYRTWFEQMGKMNIHFLRIYTIHQPGFYKELLSYNLAHESNPLFLVQGVYMPDETYIDTKNIWDVSATKVFDNELRDASLAVHGKLVRADDKRGRANGTWNADVSRWLSAWIVGVEWDPIATHASDILNAGKPNFQGKFFQNVGTNVTSTEQWIAMRMNNLAIHEAKEKVSVPIAFVDWPTADPLSHPDEPLPQEDLVGVDANHVKATKSWPGGTFASMHAYPYYPDFLRKDQAYQKFAYKTGTDAYAGYLTSLKKHYGQANLPLMITEFGVPSSIGSAHYGTNGRDQGQHSEQTAMSMDADMLYLFKDIGLAGGLMFSWTDEWFKFTWNTIPRQSVVSSERRSLWHDPLTNEQWFGIVAQDPVRNGWYTIYENPSKVEQVEVDTDASYVYLRIRLEEKPSSPLRLDFAVGDTKSGYMIEVDPEKDETIAYVRPDLDPIQLDGLPTKDLPTPGDNGWNIQRMNVNRSFIIDGKEIPAEFVEVGRMGKGNWDTNSEEYNSLAMWSLNDNILELRIPWSMLGIGDPSSKTQVVPTSGGVPKGVSVDDIMVSLKLDDETVELGKIKWEPWQKAKATERVKSGSEVLGKAFYDVSESSQ